MDLTDDDMMGTGTNTSRTSSAAYSVQWSQEQLRLISKPWTQSSEFGCSRGSCSSIRPDNVPALELKSRDSKKKAAGMESIISNLNEDFGHYRSIFEKGTNKVSEGIHDIFGAAVSSSLQLDDGNVSNTSIISVFCRRLLPTIGIFHGSSSSE